MRLRKCTRIARLVNLSLRMHQALCWAIRPTTIATTYTGREWDEDLSLYHFRARMYDSESGRFIEKDPTGYNPGRKCLYETLNSQPLSLTDPTGENALVLGVCGLAVWAIGCSTIKAQFLEGTRLPNRVEGKCLSDLKTLVPPGHCGAGIIRIDPNVGSPVTKCHPMCPYESLIFFGPRDVYCQSCFGALNTLLSILHECVHEKSQNCKFSSTNCGEYEAYRRSLQEIMRDRISLCNEMVNLGYCNSVNKCQTDLTTLIDVESGVTSKFFRDCTKDRSGTPPAVPIM